MFSFENKSDLIEKSDSALKTGSQFFMSPKDTYRPLIPTFQLSPQQRFEKFFKTAIKNFLKIPNPKADLPKISSPKEPPTYNGHMVPHTAIN